MNGGGSPQRWVSAVLGATLALGILAAGPAVATPEPVQGAAKTSIPGGCALPSAPPSTWLGSAADSGTHLWADTTLIEAQRQRLANPSYELTQAHRAEIRAADRAASEAGNPTTTGRHTGRVLAMGYAWLVTEDPRYATGLLAETRRILGYDPASMDRVDHAKLMALAASALDWAGSTASDEAYLRTVLLRTWLGPVTCWIATKDNVVTKGLNKSVVVDTSAIVTALAFAKDLPAVASAVVAAAYPYAVHAINTLKDGGTREGPGYWNFQSIPLAGLFSTWYAVHGANPAKDFPAVRGAGAFAFDGTAPDGVMTTFADSRDEPMRSTLPAWLAWRYGDSASQAIARGGELRQGIELLWWNQKASSATVRRSRAFPTTGLVVLQRQNVTGWLKGQAPIGIHSHLDAGTVGLVVDGVRWTMDLGFHDGDRTGYYEIQPDGRRWTYVNTQPRTHSTLRTAGGLGQLVGPLAAVRLNGDTASTDLTKVLGVRSAQRTMTLTERGAVIRDVVSGSRGLTWAWYTDAAITISGTTATLRKGGDSLRLEFRGLPRGSTLKVVKIGPHRALEARIPATAKLTLTVTATAS